MNRELLTGNMGALLTAVLQASYGALCESNLTCTKLIAISDQVNAAFLRFWTFRRTKESRLNICITTDMMLLDGLKSKF